MTTNTNTTTTAAVADARIARIVSGADEDKAVNVRVAESDRRVTVRLNGKTNGKAYTRPGRTTVGGKSTRGYIRSAADPLVYLDEATDLVFIPMTEAVAPTTLEAAAQALAARQHDAGGVEPVGGDQPPTTTPAKGKATRSAKPKKTPKAKAEPKPTPAKTVTTLGSGRRVHGGVEVNVKATEENAFLLVGKVSKAMRLAGVDLDEVAKFQVAASGAAEGLKLALEVAAKWVTVHYVTTEGGAE